MQHSLTRYALLIALAAAVLTAAILIQKRTPEEHPASVGQAEATGSTDLQPTHSSNRAATHESKITDKVGGQDVVMCRQLVRNWMSALQNGNMIGADRCRKAVLSYGRVAKEVLAWALQELEPATEIRRIFQEAHDGI